LAQPRLKLTKLVTVAFGVEKTGVIAGDAAIGRPVTHLSTWTGVVFVDVAVAIVVPAVATFVQAGSSHGGPVIAVGHGADEGT
jgi:hypothetical protein